MTTRQLCHRLAGKERVVANCTDLVVVGSGGRVSSVKALVRQRRGHVWRHFLFVRLGDMQVISVANTGLVHCRLKVRPCRVDLYPFARISLCIVALRSSHLDADVDVVAVVAHTDVPAPIRTKRSNQRIEPAARTVDAHGCVLRVLLQEC
jgi:hypothetical protein